MSININMKDFLDQLDEMASENPGIAGAIGAILGGMDTEKAAASFMGISKELIESSNISESQESIELAIQSNNLKRMTDGLLDAVSEYESEFRKIDEKEIFPETTTADSLLNIPDSLGELKLQEKVSCSLNETISNIETVLTIDPVE